MLDPGNEGIHRPVDLREAEPQAGTPGYHSAADSCYLGRQTPVQERKRGVTVSPDPLTPPL